MRTQYTSFILKIQQEITDLTKRRGVNRGKAIEVIVVELKIFLGSREAAYTALEISHNKLQSQLAMTDQVTVAHLETKLKDLEAEKDDEENRIQMDRKTSSRK